jgi:hypothetical protein
MSRLYVGFSYPNKFKLGAWLIALWQGTTYSHAYVRLERKNAQSFIFHAAHGMVHFRSGSNFIKENKVEKEYVVEVEDSTMHAFTDYCIDLAGEPYAKVELVKIFLSDLCYKLFGRQILFKDSRGYVCSELVGFLCEKVLGIPFDRPSNLLKPSDVDAGMSWAGYQLNEVTSWK